MAQSRTKLERAPNEVRISASLSGTAEPRIHPPTAGTSQPRRWRNPAHYFAAAWSGFFVMGVELLGGRLLAPYFGSSIFVWWR